MIMMEHWTRCHETLEEEIPKSACMMLCKEMKFWLDLKGWVTIF